MRMKCLFIIIDPQNDFTHKDGNYATRHGISQINDAISKINLVAAAKHFNTVIVRADYQPEQFIQGESMAIPGTFGHEIDARIALQDTTTIVSKPEHSCFSSADFVDMLKKERINTLVISGFLAEYCIEQTALDALASDYRVILVRDAIGTGDDVQYRRVNLFKTLQEKGCILLDAADALQSDLSARDNF
ncbi:cysteine hydrolase family protein [Mucilaginibacter sp. RCC_168]|uniref:cysteine hydrolase family protein n=1 Tax=Mucilaginibacter sp. RCC_168 TaxID=3239221 RepID=UPI0035237D4B